MRIGMRILSGMRHGMRMRIEMRILLQMRIGMRPGMRMRDADGKATPLPGLNR